MNETLHITSSIDSERVRLLTQVRPRIPFQMGMATTDKLTTLAQKMSSHLEEGSWGTWRANRNYDSAGLSVPLTNAGKAVLFFTIPWSITFQNQENESAIEKILTSAYLLFKKTPHSENSKPYWYMLIKKRVHVERGNNLLNSDLLLGYQEAIGGWMKLEQLATHGNWYDVDVPALNRRFNFNINNSFSVPANVQISTLREGFNAAHNWTEDRLWTRLTHIQNQSSKALRLKVAMRRR